MELPKHHVIQRVVLTPKVPYAEVRMEYNNPIHWEDGPYVNEIRFDRDDWEMSIEHGPSEKFKTVEAILERRFTGAKSYHGEEVVIELLEALGL